MNKEITLKEIEGYKGSDNPFLQKALAHLGLSEVAYDINKENENPFIFSKVIETSPITNQQKSGRCWIFAGLNILRPTVNKALNRTDFEFSQSYLQFFDKLEKANLFLVKMSERLDLPTDNEEVAYLLDRAIGDGGHFKEFVNLVNKYGLVPHEVMPDNVINSSTAEINELLSDILVEDLIKMKEAKASGQDPLELLPSFREEIYRILTLVFGKPKESFDYTYLDKDKKVVTIKGLTPKKFYDEYVKEDLSQFVCLTVADMEGYERYQKYGSPLVNNMIGGEEVIFFNVDENEFLASLINSLDNDEPVWFAADVAASSDRKKGLLLSSIHSYNDLVGHPNTLTKKERLTYRRSFLTHAMVFLGYHKEEEEITRFLVENSWGKENGKDGHFVMDKGWFDTYTYEIFVKKKYVDEEILKKYDASSIINVSPFGIMWAEFK